ncbi:MAG: electron transfer flavoprotein subunit alpha/FixB family protein [Candidatus Bipolaricaulia bacterium]
MAQEIFIVAEHFKGELATITFEMLGKGRELTDALGGRLCAVVLGHNVKSLAESLGTADTVLYIEDELVGNFIPEAYQRVLAGLLRERTPRLTLIGHTSVGMDLAAALSAELNIPVVGYCTGLHVADGKIVAISRFYGGKLGAEVELDNGIVTILPGAFPADKGRTEKKASVETSKPPALENLRTRFKRLIEPEAGDIDITKEEVLIAVGRGIQGQENLPIAEELAHALGGALCASRPVVDQGWLPPTRLVGRSGMMVQPKLYLALGISGAPEHIEGMKDANVIVAVNTDPNAPIFEVADYGIVGDLFEIVPKLTEELKQTKGA